jgi:linoleoyl-CoA desaturase
MSTLHFADPGHGSFMNAVAAEVNRYFRIQGISPYANAEMRIKTVAMLVLYFVPYSLIVTGIAAVNTWLFFFLWFVMAWGMIGLGTSVMHDAHHGAYSPKKSVNYLMGCVLEMIGGSSITWKIQHNDMHHTYTNISGFDEDIDSIKPLRFSPRQPRYWYHRYQYIYAWFFYLFMSLAWATTMNYSQAVRYSRHNLLRKYKLSLGKTIFRITLGKLFYFTYLILLPILFAGVPWYYVILGFLLMHFTTGIFLSCVFQPAHIVPNSDFALPETVSDKPTMANSWAEHELANTTNFAPKNRILTWFIGGLNYQIEHHLFTRICHVHYPPWQKNSVFPTTWNLLFSGRLPRMRRC